MNDLTKRSISARGLTVSDKGATIRFQNPGWGHDVVGVLQDVKYDPVEKQTLVTIVSRFALEDMKLIHVLDVSTVPPGGRL